MLPNTPTTYYANQSLNIYQMVVARLPFLVRDVCTAVTITAISVVGNVITVGGDYTYSIAKGSTTNISSLPYLVTDVTYNLLLNTTTITINSTPTVASNDFTAIVCVPDASQFYVISTAIKSYCFELERCFRIEKNGGLIAVEKYYTEEQKSIIADLVAYFSLYLSQLQRQYPSGNAPATLNPFVFLSKAKADVVETEFREFTGKFSNVDATVLMEGFIASAKRKAKGLRCIIDLCDDCYLRISYLRTLPDFKITSR